MTSDDRSDIDAVKMYLRELAAVPPLTKDEENDLLQQVRTRDEHAEAARWRIIEGNLALVVSIVEGHSSAGIDMIGLITEGNLALKTALETFHESGSDNFSEHAAQCIETAISNVLREPE
jgi:RNA polymerase primary sigma factor